MDKSSGHTGRSRGRAGSSSNPPGNSGGRGRRTGQAPPPGGSLPGPVPQGPQGPQGVWAQNRNVGGSRGTSRGGNVVPQMAVPQQRPPAPVISGRATTHRDVPAVQAQGAAAVEESSRGASRGKRVVTEFVNSRPEHIASKCGSSGERVTVQTNYYRILTKPKWSIHQYRVDFSPDVDLLRVRRAYLYQHKDIFGGFLYDGTVLFSANYFTEQSENNQREFLTRNREGETIQIKVRHVGIVDVSDAQQIQILNLVLRRAIEGLNLQLVGRNYFDPVAKINLDSYRLELWPGYQTSIRQHERNILLCAEIAHKVMRTQTLYQILMETARDFKDHITQFKNLVVGSIVLTDYNNKTYRVDDIDYNSSPASTFDTKSGKVSYVQYYKQRYNIVIKDMKQPLLVSRPTEKDIRGGQNEFIMLIPELCRATGLTDAMRSNFRLMRAMGDHTRLNPDRRMERLHIFNNRLHNSKVSMDVFKSFNMSLDKTLVEVSGRKLPNETIIFGRNKKVKTDANADWTRDLTKQDSSMYSHVDIKRWYVIAPNRNMREVQEFVKLCIRAASSMKMHISEPMYDAINDDRPNSYSNAIDRTTNNDPQLLMVVMVSPNEDRYSCIKKKCCVDRPVASQVCTLKTIAPRGDKAGGLMSIATKIVIQMNAKLMGTPWMIDLPLSGLMTVGFDVCHSRKEKNKSYGALVATMDIKLSSKYFSSVTEHLKGQELSNEIAIQMACAIKEYRTTHGALPERIIFYRDGVGDSQLHQVFNTEIKHLKSKLDEMYKSIGAEKGCRLTFVVVSKRINTRYFVNKRNPLPGTVVDDIITLPERYDFFLVSQSVRQGTVSPTSYNVIYDTMGLPPDKIQLLTYKMTHLYYNWSGTLRVPAVCQYAHKLAFLVAESVHQCPHAKMNGRLYFL